MKHPFFRYQIKNRRGLFQILIGCAWDCSPAHYAPIEKTAWALACPEACGIFTDEKEAQGALKKLKKEIDGK